MEHGVLRMSDKLCTLFLRGSHPAPGRGGAKGVPAPQRRLIMDIHLHISPRRLLPPGTCPELHSPVSSLVRL
jgi:hypothetical protein